MDVPKAAHQDGKRPVAVLLGKPGAPSHMGSSQNSGRNQLLRLAAATNRKGHSFEKPNIELLSVLLSRRPA